MKVTLILDHMVDHKLQPPNQSQIREYSHDLMKLLEAVKKVASKRGLAPFEMVEAPHIEYHILDFLAKFAHRSRYANIDGLTGSQGMADPLAEWSKIANYIISHDLSKAYLDNVKHISRELATEVTDSIRLVAHDLENRPLTLEQAFIQARLGDRIGAYSVWHVLQIVSPLNKMMVEVSHQARIVNQTYDPGADHTPDMEEFLNFLWMNKSWVTQKRRWP